MLEIQLDRTHRTYVPGETLEATLRWTGEATKWIEIQLLWETVGKGTSDQGVVASHKWNAQETQSTLQWKTVIPRGPLSMQGRLIAIEWNVIGTAHSAAEVKVPIVVAHGNKIVRLAQVNSSKD